ncbi:hypothetical protein FOS14_15275 [Skermania sp. ID1734]|uniref:Rv3235 family protein n=1 Tax=Skermania sp. ID1734 TaxID=2597516 RepID=UPI00117E3379|nr:Rv3235 family protein [Skermania sp. ID1734]TSD97337.1 hypothetical protein FOS14_15275 [Skermania sp. ID1734]
MKRVPQFLSKPPAYEPPLRDASSGLATPCHTPNPIRAVRRTPHDGRSGRQFAPANLELAAGARQFTEMSFRLILEVLDRRRQPRLLRGVLSPGLIDMVRVLSAGVLPGRDLGVAALNRVHVRMTDATTAEVFGSYQRGPRHFAVAGRVQYLPDTGWRVTALRIA